MVSHTLNFLGILIRSCSFLWFELIFMQSLSDLCGPKRKDTCKWSLGVIAVGSSLATYAWPDVNLLWLVHIYIHKHLLLFQIHLNFLWDFWFASLSPLLLWTIFVWTDEKGCPVRTSKGLERDNMEPTHKTFPDPLAVSSLAWWLSSEMFQSLLWAEEKAHLPMACVRESACVSVCERAPTSRPVHPRAHVPFCPVNRCYQTGEEGLVACDQTGDIRREMSSWFLISTD